MSHAVLAQYTIAARFLGLPLFLSEEGFRYGVVPGMIGTSFPSKAQTISASSRPNILIASGRDLRWWQKESRQSQSSKQHAASSIPLFVPFRWPLQPHLDATSLQHATQEWSSISSCLHMLANISQQAFTSAGQFGSEMHFLHRDKTFALVVVFMFLDCCSCQLQLVL